MFLFALKRIRSDPGFTAIAVLSLALGIGAGTALFSVVDAALLRLLPARNPGELYWLAVSDSAGNDRISNYPFYESLRGDPRFSGLLCAFPVALNASMHGTAVERVDAELVSGSYFETLGLRPHLGRLIAPDDDRPRAAAAVAVVSYEWWRSRLGADPLAVGRVIELNGAAYTLIGVAPPGFAGIEQGHPRSIFVPMQRKPFVTPGWDGLDKPLIAWLWIMVRLGPGADPVAIGTELDARFHAFQAPHLAADSQLTPATKKLIQSRRVRLGSLREAALGVRPKRSLAAMAFAAGGLLLMACANLAGLLLARAVEREREVATRLALGASRLRLIGQLMAESSVLACAGGLAGLMFASWAAPWLARRFPLAGEGSILDVRLDGAVLAFTFAVSLVTCILFGLLPAWRATGIDPIAAIRAAGRDRDSARLRHLLLALQAGVSFVMLAAAALFAANLDRLLSHDTGFANRQLLLAEIDPAILGYDGERRLALFRRLEEALGRAAQTPGSGIATAAIGNVAPLSRYSWSSLFVVEGREARPDLIPAAVEVGPGYFETLGIPLRRGRLLNAGDDKGAPRAAVISESLARRAFPDTDPIGRTFRADARNPAEAAFEIVGIAGDVDLSDPRRRNARECVYYSYRQWPFPAQAVVIQARLRSAWAERPALDAIRRTMRDLDPRLALYGVRTSETALARVLVAERMIATTTSFFAFVAAFLAAVGAYGAVMRQVAARRREIGIRGALGASRGALLWWVLRDTAAWVSAGIAAGVVAMSWLGSILQPLLVDVRPADPAILAMAAVLLVLVSAVAAWLPGRRAMRIDPAVALRWE